MRSLVIAVLTICLPAIGPASEPMTEALAASGPHASLGDNARLWDQFTGAWDCEYTFFLKDGTTRHESGEVLFGWILDGRAVQDIWISNPREGEHERGTGTSVRFFDRASKSWRVLFVSPVHGTLTSVKGGVEGNSIVLRGVDDDGSALRWSFNDITANSFVWRGERSRDGGKTWRIEEEHHMHRRTDSGAGKPSTAMIETLRSLSPHPSISTPAQMFGRFVGSWDVDCVFYNADGTVDRRFTGVWIFGWALDGRLVQDVLVEGNAQSAQKRGTTIRFYEPKSGQWRIVWIPPASGAVVMLRGGADGSRIVLTGQDVDGSQLRWSFNDIRDNSFFWRGEISADGGKTWRVEQEMVLKRRKESSVGRKDS